MSTPAADSKDILSALDKLFAKYFEERDDFGREKTSLEKFFGTYLRAMKDEDEARPKDWDGNTGSILTFTGLFAATVAAFVIESYKSLSRDSGDQTVVLLSQILAATTNSSLNPVPVIDATSTDSFHVPPSVVVANALWFTSLVVALACALLATLVQQWSRDYVRDIQTKDTLDENMTSRAMNHIYVRMGVDRYGMDGVVNIIVSLVHLAVFLFAAGLLVFLFPINTVVSWCTFSALSAFGIVYLVAGMIPIGDASCPYRTPLTYPLNHAYLLLERVRRMHMWTLSGVTRLQKTYSFCLDVCEKSVEAVNLRYVKILVCGIMARTWRFVKPLFLPSEPYRYVETAALSKRRIPRSFSGLSKQRFDFLWSHTSRQLNEFSASEVSLKIKHEAALAILGSIWDSDLRLALIDLLLTQHGFTKTAYGLRFSDNSDECAAILGMTCILVKGWYLRLDHEHSHPDSKKDLPLLRTFLATLFSKSTSGLAPIDAHLVTYPLRGRLALFHLRWFLLLKIRSCPESAFSITDFNSVYFAETSENDNWGDFFLQEERMLERPEGLLLLLNSWQYNALDVFEQPDSHGAWYTDYSSCLVPLHNDVCCRRRDGPLEHISACNVLTIIAHILRASEADRDDLLRKHWFSHSLLWDHDSLETSSEWDAEFKMSEEDRIREPSIEFLAVLRDAGLDSWTEGGNDLTYLPPSDTPMGKFFAENPWHGGGRIFIEPLRKLTRHVSMYQVSAGPPQDFRWLLTIPGGPETMVSNEGQQYCEGQPTTLGNTNGIPETLHLGSSRRTCTWDSFDLEQVVVDTAVGIDSSHPVGQRLDPDGAERTHTTSTLETHINGRLHEMTAFPEPHKLSPSASVRDLNHEGAHEQDDQLERYEDRIHVDSIETANDGLLERALYASGPSPISEEVRGAVSPQTGRNPGARITVEESEYVGETGYWDEGQGDPDKT